MQPRLANRSGWTWVDLGGPEWIDESGEMIGLLRHAGTRERAFTRSLVLEPAEQEHDLQRPDERANDAARQHELPLVLLEHGPQDSTELG